jgi:hypothetical protein
VVGEVIKSVQEQKTVSGAENMTIELVEKVEHMDGEADAPVLMTGDTQPGTDGDSL